MTTLSKTTPFHIWVQHLEEKQKSRNKEEGSLMSTTDIIMERFGHSFDTLGKCRSLCPFSHKLYKKFEISLLLYKPNYVIPIQYVLETFVPFRTNENFRQQIICDGRCRLQLGFELYQNKSSVLYKWVLSFTEPLDTNSNQSFVQRMWGLVRLCFK